MNANHIANYIIESGTVNQDFINKHTRFALGLDNIGDGLRPDDPRERPPLGMADFARRPSQCPQ